MKRLAICVLLIAAGVIPAAADCPVPIDNLVQANCCWDVNQDLNDYGIMLQWERWGDAACAASVADAFTRKLRANSAPSRWQSWLVGANVALVMATAMECSGRGNVSAELDQLVRDVGNNYVVTPLAGVPPCGFAWGGWKNANNCMDDNAIAASAWGWIAAYRRVSARDFRSARCNAINYTRSSLSPGAGSICISMPGRALDPSTGPCNATIAELSSGASVISLSHGNQTPAYGLGLMTSIAAGFVALDVVHASVNPWTDLTADNRTVAGGLWSEGQSSTDADGYFLSIACVFVNPNSPSGFGTWWPCWDEFGLEASGYEDRNGFTGYKAKFYPLNRFYTQYGFSKGSPLLWQFNQYDDTFDSNNRLKFFAAGRRETYITMAYDWVSSANRPSLTGNSEYKITMQLNYTNWRVTAVGGGGSSVNVNATTDGPNEMLWVYDMNGASFINHDPVRVKTSRTDTSFYLTAAGGGGGGVTATGTWTDPNALFTIEKLTDASSYPSTLIANGDTFALKTANGYYLSAVGGGGGTLMATATTVGPNETFVWHRPNDY